MSALSALILMAAVAGTRGDACPGGSWLSVQLQVRRESVAVSSDMSLSEIQELGLHMGKAPPHPVLGFSASSFRYTLQTEDPDVPGCNPIIVRLGLVLDGRKISIAREVMGNECLRAAALEHYRLHAAADSEAFTHLASRLDQSLRSQAFQTRLHSANSVADVENLLKSSVQNELPVYDSERRWSQTSVDTPAQVLGLVNACKIRI